MNGLFRGALKIAGSLCAGYSVETLLTGVRGYYYSPPLQRYALKAGAFVVGGMIEEQAESYIDRTCDKIAQFIVETQEALDKKKTEKKLKVN